jgi:hypothetical protein
MIILITKKRIRITDSEEDEKDPIDPEEVMEPTHGTRSGFVGSGTTPQLGCTWNLKDEAWIASSMVWLLIMGGDVLFSKQAIRNMRPRQ